MHPQRARDWLAASRASTSWHGIGWEQATHPPAGTGLAGSRPRILQRARDWLGAGHASSSGHGIGWEQATRPPAGTGLAGIRPRVPSGRLVGRVARRHLLAVQAQDERGLLGGQTSWLQTSRAWAGELRTPGEPQKRGAVRSPTHVQRGSTGWAGVCAPAMSSGIRADPSRAAAQAGAIRGGAAGADPCVRVRSPGPRL